MTMSRPGLSILMPVYNERATVDYAIDRVANCDFGVPIELVIVDDGSGDGTAEILAKRAARDRWISVHTHPRNQGKGKAIRTAVDVAQGRFACIFDADLEYDPADLRPLLEALTDGRAEVAYGVRTFASHNAHSYWYVLGNRFVTTMANVIFDAYLRDIMTCLKMMPLDLFRSLDIRASGFELEAEITGKVLALGHRIYELPCSYAARSREEGKKIKPTDALRVIAVLARLRLTRWPRGRRRS